MTDTATRLVRNDGSEEFTLKATTVESQVGNGLVTRSVLSAIGGIAGADPVLNAERYEVTVRVADIDASDYPNSGTYGGDNLGFARELKRAAKEYGPSATEGFEQFKYDTRSIDVVITDFQLSEDPTSDGPRQYVANLELTHVDAYVG